MKKYPSDKSLVKEQKFGFVFLEKEKKRKGREERKSYFKVSLTMPYLCLKT